MSREIKEIIENAMREAFEAGYNEGYKDSAFDQKNDGVRDAESEIYIVVRNTHWFEYQKKLNTPVTN